MKLELLGIEVMLFRFRKQPRMIAEYRNLPSLSHLFYWVSLFLAEKQKANDRNVKSNACENTESQNLNQNNQKKDLEI